MTVSKIGESLNDIFDGLEEIAQFDLYSNNKPSCPKSPFFRRKGHLRRRIVEEEEDENTSDETDDIEDEEAEILPPIPNFIPSPPSSNSPLLAALFLNPENSLSGSLDDLSSRKCLLLATSAS